MTTDTECLSIERDDRPKRKQQRMWLTDGGRKDGEKDGKKR